MLALKPKTDNTITKIYYNDLNSVEWHLFSHNGEVKLPRNKRFIAWDWVVVSNEECRLTQRIMINHHPLIITTGLSSSGNLGCTVVTDACHASGTVDCGFKPRR